MKSEIRSDNHMITAARSAHRSNHDLAVRRLRELGQRVTPQRVAVLAAFAVDGHLTAEEVCDRLAEISEPADRSTVYRILEHFRDLGLLSEVDLGHGVRSYELLGPVRHHHLVCVQCKTVLDFEDDFVAPLRQAIDDRHRFKTRLDHLALFGLCAACTESDRSVNGAPSR